MALFENCSVLLELKTLPFKEKKRLKLAVTENGGNISYVVNKQCSLIVTGDVSSLSSNRLRSIQKHQTPVVGLDYVYRCLERGVLLPADQYKLDTSPSASASLPLPPPPLSLSAPRPSPLSQQVSKVPTSKLVAEKSKEQKSLDAGSLTEEAGSREKTGNFLEKFRIYTENDNDLPTYPDNFQVAKYSIFEKVNSSTWSVLELQSVRGESGQQYCVVRYWKDNIAAKSAAVRDQLVFVSSSEEAVEVYQALREQLQAAGLQLRNNLPPQARDLGSVPLRQLLLEEELNTGSLSQEVGVFVELLWTEALGCLGNILRVSITSLSLNDVSRAEGLLLQAQKKLRGASPAEAAALLDEVYTLLPHREPRPPATAKLVSQKLDLCQLIRDVLNVSEVTLRSPAPSCLGKYRALRCSIEAVPPGGPEFQTVTRLLQDRKVQVRQVLRVSRGVELQMFKNELGNIKPLLHSSSPSSFVGILSRGLLLPRMGVEHHGIERTDIGNLGSGIYFSDAMSTSLKYSRPGATDGSRLLLVCDVALGRCRDVQRKDPSLHQAPEGYHSVHGVRRTPNTHSEFEDDEYVVYSPDQVKLKYVVQFSVDEDQLKDFSPSIDTSAELPPPSADRVLSSEEDGVGSSKNPLDDVTAGLLDRFGQQLPLQAVHVKCKLMDLLSQVVIFQKYTNQSSAPIEAKYVFPLDDSAAVCGFEAFINGKHVVGQVKEKEKARKEYKQAIEKGHGAYLMDQDAPDVFTISVGNLPPGATVLIKVTFVSELIVRDGGVLFSLPGSVAPWQQSAALNQTTQVTVEKVCVTDLAASTGEFTLDMSIEMPYEITNLHCVTHKVKVKRTDCKAVVSVLPGELMGPDGFQLSITLSEIHLPRMWVERHPDKDSQACMLVFYPDFDVPSTPSSCGEVVVLLDTSESMRGESLLSARRIALQLLKILHRGLRLNVIFFGTDQTEAFLAAQPLADALQPARDFIRSSPPAGGSTELWRPLRALSLLPPSRGLRNLLLLSDGHVQNAELTLRLLRDNAPHSRLFACGLSPTANRHMLRALAQAGGGAYEFFDPKTKHNWAEKVASQVKRMASPGCSSVSVKWQQFNPTAPPPVQAPTQLHALFNDCHTLVYGFVPHCTQATLLGDLSGQEIKTMVSTSELQKTRGTFLHKLTARAVIRDYEDGSLDTNEAEHEGKKAELKSSIIELSKEFSLLSQFTSFVAIEERDSEQKEEGFTDIPKLIAEEDVDFLPYISWISPLDKREEEVEEEDEEGEEEEELFDYSERAYYGACNMDEMEVTYGSSSEDSSSSEEHSRMAIEEDEYQEQVLRLPRLRAGGDVLPDSFVKSCSAASPPYIPTCASFASGPVRSEASLPMKKAKKSRLLSAVVCKDEAEWRPRTASGVQMHAQMECQSADLLGLADSQMLPKVQPGIPCGVSSSAKHPTSPLVSSPCPPPPPFFSVPQSSSLPPPPPPPVVAYEDLSCDMPFEGALRRQIKSRARRSMERTEDMTPPAPSSELSPILLSVKPQTRETTELVTGFGQSGDALGTDWEDWDCKHCISAQSAADEEDEEVIDYSLRSDISDAASLTGFHTAEVKSSPFGGSKPSLSYQGVPNFGLSASQPALKVQPTGSAYPGSFSGGLFGMSSQSVLTCPTIITQKRFFGAPQPRAEQGFSFGSRSVIKMTSGPRVLVGSSPRKKKELSGVPFGQGFSFGGTPMGTPMGDSLGGLRPHAVETKAALAKANAILSLRCSAPAPETERSQLKGISLSLSQPLRACLGAPLTAPEDVKLKWMKIFQMQHPEGYWECTAELGEFIKVDVDSFANVFLKNKGICSLGVRAHADILRLVATLLVLQLMRVEKLEEGKLLRTLFCLDDSPQPRSERWEAVKRAVDWVCWADRQYPCVYSRLEFGWSWESSTRQLLGYERLPARSPLSSLGTGTPLPVH